MFDALAISEKLTRDQNTIGGVNNYSLYLLRLYLEENIDNLNIFLDKHKVGKE